MTAVTAVAGALWLAPLTWILVALGPESVPLVLAWAGVGIAVIGLDAFVLPRAGRIALSAAALPVLMLSATLLGLFFMPAAAVLLGGALNAPAQRPRLDATGA